MTLSVVYALDTGHVVGAVAVTGDAEPGTVGVLVGPALPLRVVLEDGETAVLSLRDRQLAAHAADEEPGVFADPLVFGVEQVENTNSGVTAKPALLRLPPLSTPPEFNAIGLHVTVPQAVGTQATKVLALVSLGAETRALTGAIEPGETSVTLPVAVDDGPHGVLVLVAGWAGRLESVNKQ
ncbi:MAG: hypothetical protein WBA97_22610 [Actinophytocola sp.]|uniref:hypothetical protein n=1 Tax=Actinophytocola sp. TaxID=1872138 RepID=UPI003C77FC10